MNKRRALSSDPAPKKGNGDHSKIMFMGLVDKDETDENKDESLKSANDTNNRLTIPPRSYSMRSLHNSGLYNQYLQNNQNSSEYDSPISLLARNHSAVSLLSLNRGKNMARRTPRGSIGNSSTLSTMSVDSSAAITNVESIDIMASGEKISLADPLHVNLSKLERILKHEVSGQLSDDEDDISKKIKEISDRISQLNQLRGTLSEEIQLFTANSEQTRQDVNVQINKIQSMEKDLQVIDSLKKRITGAKEATDQYRQRLDNIRKNVAKKETLEKQRRTRFLYMKRTIFLTALVIIIAYACPNTSTFESFYTQLVHLIKTKSKHTVLDPANIDVLNDISHLSIISIPHHAFVNQA